MEIKVGDKVRVSKDAPKLLFTRSICNYPEYVFEVRAIEDDLADIYYGAGKIPLAAFVIPTKYLIKVDAEAKEAKFKKGDKVRFKKIYTVVSVDDGQVFIDSAGNHFDEDCLELYTKPKEQTEAEKTDTDNLKKIAEGWANEVGNAIKEYGDAMCKIHIEAQNEAYWEAYTADLAKEIAVKVANKDNAPKEAADYAVSVAKAVVENLKKK